MSDTETQEVPRLPRKVGDVGDNPLRTEDNRATLLRMFATRSTWKQVCAILNCREEALRKWMYVDESLKAQYLLAKQYAADYDLDDIEELGNEAMSVRTYPDFYPADYEGTDDDGEPLALRPHPKAGELLPGEKDKSQRIRAAIEAKRISMEKRLPKTYGNLIKLADADGEKLTVVTQTFGALLARPGDDAKVIDHDPEERPDE